MGPCWRCKPPSTVVACLPLPAGRQDRCRGRCALPQELRLPALLPLGAAPPALAPQAAGQARQPGGGAQRELCRHVRARAGSAALASGATALLARTGGAVCTLQLFHSLCPQLPRPRRRLSLLVLQAPLRPVRHPVRLRGELPIRRGPLGGYFFVKVLRCRLRCFLRAAQGWHPAGAPGGRCAMSLLTPLGMHAARAVAALLFSLWQKVDWDWRRYGGWPFLVAMLGACTAWHSQGLSCTAAQVFFLCHQRLPFATPRCSGGAPAAGLPVDQRAASVRPDHGGGQPLCSQRDPACPQEQSQA